MSKVKVSIIIPIYNGEKYIEKTIKSVQNQSLKNIEIICVNDGSTDNTKYILDELSKYDSRIKVIHQNNSGVSYSRNQGILASCGEYIGFVDADDTIDFNMYEVLYNKAIDSNCDVVCSGFIEETDDGTILRKYTYPYFNELLKNDDIKLKTIESLDNRLEIIGGPSIWSKLYKRSLLIDNNISMSTDITIGEDFCFNIEVFYNAKTIGGVDGAFYHYMSINQNSLMRSNTDKTFINFIKGRKFILKTLDKYNLSSKEYTQFEYAKNFANLIQIADFRIRNKSNFKDIYNEVLSILKSSEIKNSINLTSTKYLSRNLNILKKLINSNMYFLAFSILYTRVKIKK